MTRPCPSRIPPRPERTSRRQRWIRRERDGRNGSEHAQSAAELLGEYEVRANRASIEGQDLESKISQLEAQQRLRLVAIDAAREELAGRAEAVDVEALRALGAELDLEEQWIRRALNGG